ncbi:hypothetical protein TPHA_0E01410 [Tetrapisispora phaffii CBS 4417]|uniref:Signal recognition particle receptor subunit alpha homolog n=1 Tax=Tetrapisispora phaffii (strain ATCC 24235 / CBS 4417 / NBRC 1672 / NRRL Y-8282 / UCD 70-5) TaxID=1071381 RepID=G8BTK8_TETPH|nr:hypothetical protein TPHA_0E01410 [Tetrapisispora phaffii CBS 4417]CCE63236.1 hypothetical protein TPHA_0E01410 [Tetrapisispora phaffii CBS 4417]
MFDQLAIFTPQGEVLYQYNPSGKKFAETQVNAFINHLMNSPISKKNDVHSKFSLVNISPTVGDSSNSSKLNFSSMFYISKQPELYYLVTFPEQKLDLKNEAEETLNLALSLWDSLGLNDSILQNLKNRTETKNWHNYIDLLYGTENDFKKFKEYFVTKYEDSIAVNDTKIVESSQVDSATDGKKVTNTKRNNEGNAKKNKNGNNGGRKWGRGGNMEDGSNIDASTLDFSEHGTPDINDEQYENISQNKDDLGKRTEKGDFLVKEIDELLASQKELSNQKNTEGKPKGFMGSAYSYLQKNVIGNKTITKDDLNIILEELKQQLISKNVAPEAADFLAQQVSRDLLGSKTSNWTSVQSAANDSLTKALTQILTPGISVDLLHEVQKKTSTLDADGKKQPYIFSVVGVNGVGKSTNLSKLAFWLLQNNFKVLIVACDTFRSGAVEQLRVHVENLAQLTEESHVRGSKNKRGKSGNDSVELFEAGYGGSDLVTKIAKQAIKYAKDNSFDIVLMDTAGRRHNDPTLMSPLKSFAEQANPDKIIMVGEALVGTDSVQQAKNFNDAFGKVRNLDFLLISKCDTVGTMLGSMVNMVYATGIPILFVGVGQTYTDLRTLSVKWAVDTLMS